MENYEFERKLVAVLSELIERRGLKHEPTAKLAWPDKKDAGPAWQKIRNRKPPQRLSVREAFGLAKVLGVSMSSLCCLIEGREFEKILFLQHSTKQTKKNSTSLAKEPDTLV